MDLELKPVPDLFLRPSAGASGETVSGTTLVKGTGNVNWGVLNGSVCH